MAQTPPRYAFYPGCCGARPEGRALSRAALACCRVLGLYATELPGWSCCGGQKLMDECPVGSAALAVRNLAFAGRAGEQMLALCPGCAAVTRRGMRLVEQQPGLAEHMTVALGELGLALPANWRVRHLLAAIMEDAGAARIKQATVRPLTGVRVACYYGCGLAKSPGVRQRGSSGQGPLETLIDWLGGEAVRWEEPGEGCVHGETGAQGVLAQFVFSGAVLAGADCISAACPCCVAALKSTGSEADCKPVFFAQLLAGAFGLPIADAGLRIGRHGKRAVVRFRRKRTDGDS